jgi:hypothetical protein
MLIAPFTLRCLLLLSRCDAHRSFHAAMLITAQGARRLEEQEGNKALIEALKVFDFREEQSFVAGGEGVYEVSNDCAASACCVCCCI